MYEAPVLYLNAVVHRPRNSFTVQLYVDQIVFSVQFTNIEIAAALTSLSFLCKIIVFLPPEHGIPG
jgi:hypothetical protein